MIIVSKRWGSGLVLEVFTAERQSVGARHGRKHFSSGWRHAGNERGGVIFREQSI